MLTWCHQSNNAEVRFLPRFTNVIRLKLPSLIKNDSSGKALASGRRTMFNTPQELQSIF
tara:strand:+ start:412 stop:588 length:177 start_codon:yes stop_codon:yes gene_type:complete